MNKIVNDAYNSIRKHENLYVLKTEEGTDNRNGHDEKVCAADKRDTDEFPFDI